VGDGCVPNRANGKQYYCITAGTSGGSQPAWTTGEGDNITDGTVVWACHDPNASNSSTQLAAADVGKWKQSRVDNFCPRNATGGGGFFIVYRQTSGADGTFYLAEPTLMVGHQGPRGVVLSQNEFQDSMMLGGMRIDRGTAPPTDGRWCNRGDVRFNSNASPGQAAGWMCTTSGTAGSGAVWKVMGNLAN
jgi:hypothetical protein